LCAQEVGSAVGPATVRRRLAAKRVASSSVPVEYVGLDGQALSQESASIDRVLTTWTVCSIPDVDRALGAIRRVLRPGGFGARPLTRAQGRGLAGRCEESWGAKLGGKPKDARTTRPPRPDAMEDRTRLQATQRRTRPGPLRRTLLARVVSPHRAGDRRARVPDPGAAAPKSPAAGLTLPQAILLFQPLLKCWTGRCQTCQQPVDLDRLALHPVTQTERQPNKALLVDPPAVDALGRAVRG